MEKYDVVIVGAGPAGLFAAYELITNNPKLKIVLVDEGKKAEDRFCPMNRDHIPCVNCKPCQILSGFGGAGTFSDGKLNFIPKLGKSDLFKYMSEEEAYNLIDDTERIFTKFKMDSDVYPSDDSEAKKLQKEISRMGARLLLIKQKHLGSDHLPKYIEDFTNYLKDNGVVIKDRTRVIDIVSESIDLHKVIMEKGSKKENIMCNKVIIAPGRTGAKWVQELADEYKIPYLSQSIEIGVRVETRKEILEDLCDIIY